MSLTFKVEKWGAVLPELRPLFSELWQDVAVAKHKFVAKCDEETYAKMDAIGLLHVVTARSAGELAGFFVLFVMPNAHYLGGGLHGFTDMYFLKPEFRKGNAGLQLFAAMEESLRARGVVRAYTSHKIHRDRSRMLEGLGWTATDIIYAKIF